MAYYADLSRYEYLPTEQGMINVGWLAADRDFPTDPVPDKVIAALLVLADDVANLLRGVHDCEFCEEESPVRVPAPVERGYVSLGMGELHVEGRDGRLYSAPSLIVHYISEHCYWPPPAFQEAVLFQVGAA